MDTIDFLALDPSYAEDASVMGPEFRLIYRSSSEVPSAIHDALRDIGALEFTQFERVPFSAKELDGAREDLSRRFLEVSIDNPGAVRSDASAGQLVLYTQKPVDSRTRSSLAEQIEVPIDWQSVPNAPRPAVNGGRKLDFPAAGATAGFVVRNISNNNRGLSTAGHAPNTSATYASAGGVTVNFKGDAYTNSTLYDAQWMDAGGITWSPQVYVGQSGVRDVTSVRSYAAMDPGDPVISGGRNTGYKSGTIDSVGWCPAQAFYSCGSGIMIYVRPNNSITDWVQPGDSGGPVMLNGAAYGIHHAEGIPGLPGGSRGGFYMPAQFFGVSIGVAVVTQ